jgi:hypothetical protein
MSLIAEVGSRKSLIVKLQIFGTPAYLNFNIQTPEKQYGK